MRIDKQSKLLKMRSKILSNLFNKKYEPKLGEFNNTTGTERVEKERKILNGYKPIFSIYNWLIELQLQSKTKIFSSFSGISYRPTF